MFFRISFDRQKVCVRASKKIHQKGSYKVFQNSHSRAPQSGTRLQLTTRVGLVDHWSHQKNEVQRLKSCNSQPVVWYFRRQGDVVTYNYFCPKNIHSIFVCTYLDYQSYPLSGEKYIYVNLKINIT